MKSAVVGSRAWKGREGRNRETSGSAPGIVHTTSTVLPSSSVYLKKVREEERDK
jgi:hypothetical protein